ncbi:uncharacterized protein [Haliotis cracherodii]|uniref:uncharacterized protein n=1 Tax=Haliotis cracherodii TaxID=6455 RepID=UPI0039E7BF3D
MIVWTNVVFILGLCTSLSLGELVSRHVCSNQSETSTSLECEHPGRIHLVRVLYRKTSPGCVTQDDTCEYLQETQKQGLRTDCQGASSCLQGISSFWLTDTCGPTTSYIVTLSYECVTDPSIDICSNTAVSSGAGYTLYLATPNYPRGVLNTSNTCACHVVGAAMNVYILGLFFRHREGDRATMTLRGENSVWNSHPDRYFVYNTQAMDSVDSLHLRLAANVKIGQHAWIKIESAASMTVTCSGGAPAHTPSSLKPPANVKEDTAVIVGSVVGTVAVIGLLLLVAAVVYLCCCNRKATASMPTNEHTYTHFDHVIEPPDQSEVPVHEHMPEDSDSNTYQRLDICDSQDGDHDYRKLDGNANFEELLTNPHQSDQTSEFRNTIPENMFV